MACPLTAGARQSSYLDVQPSRYGTAQEERPMNTTTADNDRRADAHELQERAPTTLFSASGTGDAAADIVPVVPTRFMKAPRFLAFLATMLINMVLAWIFVRALVGISFGAAQVNSRWAREVAVAQVESARAELSRVEAC
jgi:hypothetical protein